MLAPTRTIAGVEVPQFLYGTAWKEAATAGLVELAIRQGFRGIDTANQRKHYHESGVGQGIVAAVGAGVVERDELFLQTKFTFQPGQDHRLPYDPQAAVTQQVEQSFASSLEHLGCTTLDSYVLHGPMVRTGLSKSDWEAWRAMEALHAAGRTRLLGISNVGLDQLELLCQQAQVKPHFVQNRCYASLGWDREVRDFCTAQGIVYQGFSLLTANRGVINHPRFAQIAARHGRTLSQTVFRFALDVGMLPLTGTTSAEHMQMDLAVFDDDFRLTPEEIWTIQELGAI